MVDIARNHHDTTAVIDTTTDAPRRPATDARSLPPVRLDRQPATTGTGAPPDRSGTAVRYVLAGVRLALGWVFLWAFLDNTFGLGHDTPSAKSWINGGSPTKGFLGSASAGPFSGFYHSIAGNGAIDVLFMAALLGIGAALILGIGMRLAAAAGVVLTVMMWSAVLPPDSNPFMDDHLIYAGVLVVLALLAAGNTLGFGRMWARLPLVQRLTWLK
jgi:thiosulfate dehydrogenase [quinone] large subunit